MKTKIFILNKDNTVKIVNRKKLEDKMEIDGSTYLLTPQSIFIPVSSTGKDKHRHYLFLSRDRINSVRTNETEIVNTDVLPNVTGKDEMHILKNNSDNEDKNYQILLHSKALKDLLPVESFNMLQMMLFIGMGALIGLIIGLTIGHVKL